MNAYTKNISLVESLNRAGINANTEQAHTLRRAELTLHRWAELECGDGNDYASWAIERDENDGRPYFVTYPHKGDSRRRRIADRERGALVRVEKLCKELGIYFYHQTDPRGCVLYVSAEPLTDQNYSRGVPCSR